MSMADVREEQVKALREALQPFAMAFKRLDDEDGDKPTDDVMLFAVDDDNCQFELFADGRKEIEMLRVGHLAKAAAVFDSTGM